ncbi:MAG: hypothetical protein JW751_28570 [Polyangiaceae bacterium]|nr:hypothetical protein [Polyangiaceae bacterium]
MALFLASGTATAFIAACYGPPTNNVLVGVSAKDGAEDPIEGLSVRLNCPGIATSEQTTDAGGLADLEVEESVALSSCSVTITDTDGADNGGEFASRTIPLTDGDTQYDVVMASE